MNETDQFALTDSIQGILIFLSGDCCRTNRRTFGTLEAVIEHGYFAVKE
jgi:hypothetical protein